MDWYKRQKKQLIVYESSKPQIKTDYPLDYQTLLSTKKIPSVKHERMAYFHGSLVILEEIIHKNERPNVAQLMGPYRLVEELHLFRRETLSQNHRLGCWLVISRYHLLITNELQESNNDYGTFNSISSLDITYKKKDVLNLTMAELWWSFIVLMKKFNFLRYSKDLEYYIDCLMTRTCMFMIITSKDSKEYDLMGFVKYEEDSNIYHANELFFRETERLFYGFNSILYYRKKLYELYPKSTEYKQYKATNIDVLRFIAWMEHLTSTEYFVSVKREFKETIYNNHIFITERDRFLKEKKMSSLTPYNILCTYRQDYIDKILKELEEDLMKKILSIRKSEINERKDDNALLLNRDLDLVYFLCMKYYFEVYFSDSTTFKSHLISNPYQVTESEAELRSKRQIVLPVHLEEKSHKVPFFIQTFHEYELLYKGKMIECRDIESCIFTWIKIICEEENANGFINGSQINLKELYKILFPENKQVISNMESFNDEETNLPYKIQLPAFYENGSNVFQAKLT